MNKISNILAAMMTALLLASCSEKGPEIHIQLAADQPHSNRMWFAAEQLQKALADRGCTVSIDTTQAMIDQPLADDALAIALSQAPAADSLAKEGFHITTAGQLTRLVGNDASGIIYGARELIDNYISKGSYTFPADLSDAPEMVLRGPCIGVQKTQFLPGHGVYEYPYTPENFPWFYDREMWIRYLDMMVENRMNSLYLWNGHPFASLVKLEDYPFAVEVDDETFQKNRELFTFLTTEADRRGIFVIQMFYNIIVSKPFADHYGIKTQDRNPK